MHTLSRILLLAGGIAVGLGAAEPRPTVVLVSVDGLPADYFANPAAAMPTLRRMARNGARAERMRAVFPTVTWPNHTSLVTGVSPARHGVVGNLYYDRAARKEIELIWDPVFDQGEIVKVPTIYDVAHRAGLKTAGISWPGSRNARHLDWQMPCVAETELLTRFTTPALLDILSSLGIAPEKKAEWAKIDGAGKALWDWMHTQVAVRVLKEYRPHLLLLHLNVVDALEHRNGRDSPEAYWACQLADRAIADLIAATEEAGLAARTTFFVVSDHGFHNYTKLIHVNAVLRDAGLITTAGTRIVESRAHFLSASGSGGIYILDEPNRATITRELVAKLQAVEGVSAVLIGDEIASEGLASATADPRVADIMLSAADGYAFAKGYTGAHLITPLGGVKGAHGYLPGERKLGATFIAWGAAIKPGIILPEMRALDVAPTMAAVLGVPLPENEGRVLSEILR